MGSNLPPPPPGFPPLAGGEVESPARRIRVLHDQAYRLRRGGQIAEAEAVFLSIVEEAGKAGEAIDDALRADVQHWVAVFYRDSGRAAEAEGFARAAVEMEERAGRAAIVANHHLFLADLLEKRGEIGEALTHAERALVKQTEALGAEHRETRYYASVVERLRRKAEGG